MMSTILLRNLQTTRKLCVQELETLIVWIGNVPQSVMWQRVMLLVCHCWEVVESLVERIWWEKGRSLWTCSWRTMGSWPLLFLCLLLLATKIWPVLSSGLHTVMYFLDTNSKSIGLRSHGLKPLRQGTKSIFLFLKKDDYIRYFITVIKN